MATAISRSKVRPAKDEWGVYDPQQAGLAAVLARLDAKEPKAVPADSPSPAAKLADTTTDAPRLRPSKLDAK